MAGYRDKNKAESFMDMNGAKQFAPKLKMRKLHGRRMTYESCLTKLVALKPVADEA